MARFNNGSRKDKTSLHTLLEDVNKIHKKDMKEINAGHLNENKLLQKKEKIVTAKIWGTANKPAVRMRRKVPLKDNPIFSNRLPPLDQKVVDMRETITDFMLGPNEALKGLKGTRRKTSSPPNSPRCSSGNGTILPDLMLPLSPRKKDGLELSNEFIPPYHAMPSKHDQYQHFQHVHHDLLKVHPPASKKNLTVEEIERKLRKRLEKLEKEQDVTGPNFFKLKIYSDAWEELCNSSETYGDVLRVAKTDYDAYVEELLDKQIKLDEPSKDRLHLITADKNENRLNVKEMKNKVTKLEDEILKEMNENEKLCKELKEAESSQDDISSILHRDVYVHTEENNNTKRIGDDKDLEQQVYALHAQIELQLLELDHLKKDKKENYVPLAMCQRLEQCIKETEVDMQKLQKQNEFLEHNIEELEDDLENLLIKTGIKTKDDRTLWKRVSTTRLLDM